MKLPGNQKAVIDALRSVPTGMVNTAKGVGRMALNTIADPRGAGETVGRTMQGVTDYAANTTPSEAGQDLAGVVRGAYDRFSSSPEQAGEMVGENINPLGLMKKVAGIGLLAKVMNKADDIPEGGGGLPDVPEGPKTPDSVAPRTNYDTHPMTHMLRLLKQQREHDMARAAASGTPYVEKFNDEWFAKLLKDFPGADVAGVKKELGFDEPMKVRAEVKKNLH